MSDPFHNAAEAIRKASLAIAVTGAGISVESGIPDFRSEGGLWTKFPPYEYATIEAFYANPAKVWAMFRELGQTLRDASPNPAHYALARLEDMGRLDAIITQNIDALHERAGSQDVIEYHGSVATLTCPRCGAKRSTDTFDWRAPEVPHCECRAILKPDVILFGEMIPPEAMMRSEMLAQDCDVVLIVGTSAQVYPAASLPLVAKENGAYIIECNIEPTDFTRRITDAFLQGPAGETLPQLVGLVEAA